MKILFTWCFSGNNLQDSLYMLSTDTATMSLPTQSISQPLASAESTNEKTAVTSVETSTQLSLTGRRDKNKHWYILSHLEISWEEGSAVNPLQESWLTPFPLELLPACSANHQPHHWNFRFWPEHLPERKECCGNSVPGRGKECQWPRILHSERGEKTPRQHSSLPTSYSDTYRSVIY